MAAKGVLVLPVWLQSCNRPVMPGSDRDTQIHPDDFELNEVTVAQLRAQFKSGRATSANITKLYLDRISAVDHSGPQLRSVIEINPDAMADAVAMDKEMAEGKDRGLLHGMPVLVKDNVDIAGKMLNTAGSIAMEGNVPKRDAFIIKKLREAGAVILGKTNLSEWANFRSSQSSSGWSSRGGQTRNPYELSRNPCGSSSGSGAAVSANLCVVAIGTETNGSIVCPASMNGVVGIKPTVGLWSRTGIIPISATQDTAGPMARTVADAAAMLGLLAATDEADSATALSNDKKHDDYTAFLNPEGLKGKRIGIERSYLKRNEKVDVLFASAINALTESGAEVVEVDFLELMKGVGSDEYTLLLYEFKDGLNRYLSTANGKVKTLEQLIAFNEQHRDAAMPIFGQNILVESQSKGGLTDEAYLKALKNVVNTSRGAIDETLKKFGLHAICGPSYGPAGCTDHVNGNYSTGYGFSGPAAMAGYPHITVPCGFVSGLPVGLSFFAEAWSEPKLIEMAYAFEQKTKVRRPPNMVGAQD